MLLALHVYSDTCNSECHDHDCKGECVAVHDSSFRVYWRTCDIECSCGPSIKRSLRPPVQSGEIRVLASLRRPVEFRGLPLDPTFFFVTLFLLPRFLTIPLSLGGFTYSCDGALLSGTMCRYKRPTAMRLHVSESSPPCVAIWGAHPSGRSGRACPNSIPNWRRM